MGWLHNTFCMADEAIVETPDCMPANDSCGNKYDFETLMFAQDMLWLQYVGN